MYLYCEKRRGEPERETPEHPRRVHRSAVGPPTLLLFFYHAIAPPCFRTSRTPLSLRGFALHRPLCFFRVLPSQYPKLLSLEFLIRLKEFFQIFHERVAEFRQVFHLPMRPTLNRNRDQSIVADRLSFILLLCFDQSNQPYL